MEPSTEAVAMLYNAERLFKCDLMTQDYAVKTRKLAEDALYEVAPVVYEKVATALFTLAGQRDITAQDIRDAARLAKRERAEVS